MTYRPLEPQTDWDFYGAWITVIVGLLFVVFGLGGCATIREDQKQRDIKIVDFALSNYQWELRNPYDRNTLNRLRWDLRKKLNDN